MVETVELLEQAGLPQVGAGRNCADASRARILEVKGIKVAFVAGTLLFNDDRNRGPKDPCAFFLDDQKALRRHMTIFVDGVIIRDRVGLSDPVADGSTVYVFQALSGG